MLTDAVASQVAAGEVVERPASVLKELVENSLDAGASRIDIEYHRGGDKFLAVTDDGRGMDREDALLCLERHATSKIRTGRDLSTVGTFGFRGEALPSIASVSRFRLVTREDGAAAGTEVLVNGGKVEDVRDSGEARGTRIEVRSLFFNLPARRKFLRGERTEAAHLDHHFQILALSHPSLRFSLTKDGRQAHLLAPAAGLLDRVRDLCGAEFASQLFPLESVTRNGITLSGLLGRPGHGRADRGQQFVFVNGRAVHSPTVYQPLREAYGTAMAKGMNPPAVVFLSLDPEAVDCNVHPAKREVRFRDGFAVRDAVRGIVEAALAAQRRVSVPMPVRVFSEPAAAVDVAPAPPPSAAEIVSEMRRLPVAPPSADVELPLPPAEPAPPPRFRYIGVLADRYALLEDADGLVLLDNRAARERILFEQLLRRFDARQSVSQRLLMPSVVELPPRDLAWIREHSQLLAGAGLLVEAFGAGAVKVDGVPPMLAREEPRDVLLRIVDDCRAGGARAGTKAVEESIAKSVCHSAAFPPPPEDARASDSLVGELMDCELPYACPAGKPTMIHFARSELERKFGRGRQVSNVIADL